MIEGTTLGEAFPGGVISYLCHKLGRCRGDRIFLANDHGGDGGGGGEGVPWGLDDGCAKGEVGAEGRQLAPRLVGLR